MLRQAADTNERGLELPDFEDDFSSTIHATGTRGVLAYGGYGGYGDEPDEGGYGSPRPVPPVPTPVPSPPMIVDMIAPMATSPPPVPQARGGGFTIAPVAAPVGSKEVEVKKKPGWWGYVMKVLGW